MGASFMQGNLNRLTRDNPCDHRDGGSPLLGTKQSLECTGAQRIAKKDPLDGDRRNAGVLPQHRARCHRSSAAHTSLPINGVSFWVNEALGQRRLALAFDRRSPLGLFVARQRESGEIRIQTHARYHNDSR